jgi:hypothetical protein
MQKNFGKDFTWFLTKKIEISQKNIFSTEKRFLTLIYIKTHKRILAEETQHFSNYLNNNQLISYIKLYGIRKFC